MFGGSAICIGSSNHHAFLAGFVGLHERTCLRQIPQMPTWRPACHSKRRLRILGLFVSHSWRSLCFPPTDTSALPASYNAVGRGMSSRRREPAGMGCRAPFLRFSEPDSNAATQRSDRRAGPLRRPPSAFTLTIPDHWSPFEPVECKIGLEQPSTRVRS